MKNYEQGLCSICCLGYKHVNFLEQNIRSIWEVDYRQIEIIALDDGSNDGSAELLYSLANQSPIPMKVVIQNNTGNIAKNLNKISKMANGEFLIGISLDDYFLPTILSKKLNIINLNKNLAFIGSSSVVIVDQFGNFIKNEVIDLPFNVNIDYLLELEYSNLGSIFLQDCIVRSEIFNYIEGYDETTLANDLTFRTKLFKYMKNNTEYTFILLNESSFCYRKHGGNIHKNITRQIRSVSEYLAKHWPDREPPTTYIKWVLAMIAVVPFEQYIVELTYNDTSSKLLNDPKIKKAILKSFIISPKLRGMLKYIKDILIGIKKYIVTFFLKKIIKLFCH
ncbi:MAG: glycosyltransferase family 2 protein [Rickettsiales bacterium]|jgi:alpha-1,3-rhamnosyltransferase|nr:glycosyltransferase family 2 protein [Rickettsiales bacterium]